ncbi:hypothetical protein SLS62_010723 [Diatrype stigma]|uniref:Xylanolytic transcriptional activator regulatory domain-containing protein n=1 Tax=Diatrype stigma TaxID=117547 RepID=A0AAN9UA56_9PEZI
MSIAEMPSKGVILDLVDIFLSKFIALIPCFHEQRLRDSIEKGELQNEAPVLVYIMVAMAARSHQDESIRRQEKGWYTNAKLAFDLTTHDSEPALRILQAAACLVTYANIVYGVSPMWTLLGKAWRLACSHGYNRIDTKFWNTPAFTSPSSSEVEKEERRRAMWVLFMFDRGSSFAVGWPHAINEQHFVVNRPLNDQSFQTGGLGSPSSSIPTPLDPFQILINTYKLAGQVVEHTYVLQVPEDFNIHRKEFDQLGEDLAAITAQSAEQIQNLWSLSERGQIQAVWTHIVAHAAQIILNHRPLDDWAIITGGSTDAAALQAWHDSHFQRCIRAADTIIQRIKYLERASPKVLINPHIGSSLYMIERILVICWHETREPRYRQDIDTILLLSQRLAEEYPRLGQGYITKIKRDLELDANTVQRMRALGSRGGVSGCRSLPS